MLKLFALALGGFLYLVLGRLALHLAQHKIWRWLFPVLNLAGIACLFYSPLRLTNPGPSFFLLYLILILTHYLLLMRIRGPASVGFWSAFLFPLFLLLAARGLPHVLLLTGISYMAFRLSYLAIEIRNGTVARPSLPTYLGYAFFIPTFLVGPINPFSVHQPATDGECLSRRIWWRAALRILIGAVKFRVLASLAHPLSFGVLWSDGYDHSALDFFISSAAYYLYLYFNFSGICDMAIGVAAILGVRVLENFDRPFAARNVKEFWNRWHITLSVYMRDVVFTPLSKMLVRAFGVKAMNHAIALTVLVVFVLVGIWHGTGWNFLFFGLAHGLAVVANHYYLIGLKKRLGKGLARYLEHRGIKAAAIGLTFIYVSLTFFFFANDLEKMKFIWSHLRLFG